MFGFLRRNVVTLALIVLVLATSHSQIVQAIDLIQDGHIIFTGPSPEGARDIRTSTNDGGLRFYNGNGPLTNPPEGAAIQFFGNDRGTFNGQAFIDSGAHANAALIFRTAGAGQGVSERMRIESSGDITSRGRFAMGDGAVLFSYGEKAVANGSFASPGDAQGSTFILRGLLPLGGTTPVSLTLDGASQLINVPEGVMTLEMIGAVSSPNGVVDGFTCLVTAKTFAGATTISGNTICTAVPGVLTGSAFYTVIVVGNAVTVQAIPNPPSFSDNFHVVVNVRTARAG
jgi:hypothetical protein